MGDADATRYVHAADRVHVEHSATAPVAPPIYQTTVYGYSSTDQIDSLHRGDESGYIYGRYGLPNARALEEALAQLEGAEAGLATSSATSGILATLIALTSAGDRVVVGHNTYGGTRGLLDAELSRFGLETTYVDVGDISAVESALAGDPQPALLWADTISNPTLLANDIPALAGLANDREIPFVVDNTFATPLHFNPIESGATLVIHSGTKFIGGHNDVSSGAVLGPIGLVEKIRRTAILTGAVVTPFDAWLSLRGLRTMEVRVMRSSASALAIAGALDGLPGVDRVHYPGLPSDPRHAIASRILKHGFGSLVSVDFGDEATARKVVDDLSTIQIAETLGGLMTTAVIPSVNYYRHLDAAGLARIGVSPGLVRFSIGIESADDLIADLTGAIGRAA
ncbi:MAG: aminotransferase class I/II-fold pyridoxal phosphate-dependent enzyme [Thermomicrobiales bacterium]